MQIPRLQKLMSVAQMVLPALGATLFFAVVALHVHDQVRWRSNYSQVSQFGEHCRYDVGTFPGSADQVMQSEHHWTVMQMPWRGQPNAPKVYPKQFLLTECDVPLNQISASGFAVINLGFVYGPSVIYWNATKVAATKGGDMVEFPVPPHLRSGQGLVTIVSEGEEDGAVGLASLRPPYLATSPVAQKLVTRFLNSVYTEQTMLRMGASAAIILFLMLLRTFGLRFADVQWLASFGACVFLTNFLQYMLQFNTSFKPWTEHLLGCFNLATGFTQAMFLLAFARTGRRSSKAVFVISILTICFAAIILFSSEALFYSYRLLVFTPTVYGLALQLGLLLWFVLHQTAQKHDHVAQRRRTRQIAVVSLITTIILGIQVYLDEVSGIYLHSLAQFTVLAVFTGMLTFDLARRQRDYFIERSLRAREQQDHAEAKAIAETAKFVAHDFQKPFELINLFATKLKTVPADQLDKFVSEFQKSLGYAERDAKQLIDDLTSFSPAVGTLHSVVRLEDLCDGIQLPVADLNKSVALTLSVAPHLTVSCDVRSIRRVLANIVQNAIDAMPKTGSIHITAGERQGSARNEVIITIRNSGSTVAPSHLERIFDLGFTSGKVQGKGLGLAYCRKVIGQHGGKIWCESQNNETEFSIVLPSATSTVAANPRMLNIAVIDDDEFVHFSWQNDPSEHKVSGFIDPAAFLAEARGSEEFLKRFDTIILDRNFRRQSIDGVALAKALKSLPGCPPLLLASTNPKLDEDTAHYFHRIVPKGPLTSAVLQEILIAA